MEHSTEITTLFLDIGGVLLTDGWGHLARKRAATHFKLERAEMEDRHHLNFEIAEGVGIRSILHTAYRSTYEKLASFGLEN